MTGAAAKARLPWLLGVGLSGACVMAVELSAVRLLAPWFGASLVVWTNVIGVLLLALAIGALLGARLASGDSPGRRAGVLLLIAGLLTAALPWLAEPTARLFLPASFQLAEAGRLLAYGSLACSGALFVLPAIAFGAVGPLAVEGLTRGPGLSAGRAGGLILGCSTIGSLIGTFATTHVVLPEFGLTRGFFGIAALAVLAATAMFRAGGTRVGAALSMLIVVGLLIPASVESASARIDESRLGDGVVQLAEVESAYQRVRVTEQHFGETPYRFLAINEVSDSYQSVWTPQAGLLGPGFYYDDFVLPYRWRAARASRDGRPAPQRERTLVLGFGGGTAHRVLRGAIGGEVELSVLGVEIDPEVVRLGQLHFELPVDDPQVTVWSGLDARVALAALSDSEQHGPFDTIVLDCYANAIEIPPHLSTVEFFEQVRGVLAPGGLVVANVGAFGLSDPVLTRFASTLSSAFGRRALALPVLNARNVSVFIGRDLDPPDPSAPEFRLSGSEAAWLSEPRRVPGNSRWFEPSEGLVSTDDRNPIDALAARGLMREAEHAR